MYTHTYAHENTCACMTLSTRWNTDTKTHNLCTNMHTHTHTHVYERMDVQTHTHMHIYTYVHVCTHTHIHIYAHTHTKCTYETHASTLGTTAAQQRTCKELLQTKEALHLSFVRRNPTTFRTSNARTSLWPRSAALIPPQPPSPLPNIPQNSSKLAQLHNGPLHSCRKIGGKAAVLPSCSKRARRNPSPKMIKVTVHEETRGQWKKRPNPATAHTQSRERGEQKTSRSSALVRGRSTQFIANPWSWPRRPCLKRGYISAIFPPSLKGWSARAGRCLILSSCGVHGRERPVSVVRGYRLDWQTTQQRTHSLVRQLVSCFPQNLRPWRAVDPCAAQGHDSLRVWVPKDSYYQWMMTLNWGHNVCTLCSLVRDFPPKKL